MNETNIGTNWAHQPARWWVYGIVIATVVLLVVAGLAAALFG
ncbi:hypothetical protein QP027_06835 [Corynebacterium breve]|uniref:Uncharacterized protein n=1 Tax=Corynebacterium breve TaxID=3049799 RepID=A0ABY8VB15_9CORY|nr:hypothetical protein [Corynebacterium breve]WIM66849.1 hypothetical protein QP027_06835 [Corynebacterium breve]